MILANYRYIYFIGIGGIGMSALARWFGAQKKYVAGYDKTPTTLTSDLQSLNISIHFEDKITAIPEPILNPTNRSETLIIWTPAIPQNHSQLAWFRKENYTVCKRAEVLGLLSRMMPTIAIAGTHGKTSTTALLAYLYLEQNQSCLAFVGGISQNYQSNTLWQNLAEAETLIVEADEYDRSFLALSPKILIITAIESDHLDIYGSFENVKKSFETFVQQLDSESILYLHEEVELDYPAGLQVYRYGIKESSTIRAEDIHDVEGGMAFDYIETNSKIPNLKLGTSGYYNVINALPCLHIINQLCEGQELKSNLKSYRGVKRRFEYVLQKPFVMIDDYAHHPTEVRAFLTSVRQKYPTQIITAIFQPHLFSRTRDFAAEFAEALDLADRIFLLPIYPAREEPIPNVDSNLIFKALKTEAKYLVSKHELLEQFKHDQLEILVTIGAGDIGELVEPLKNSLVLASR